MNKKKTLKVSPNSSNGNNKRKLSSLSNSGSRKKANIDDQDDLSPVKIIPIVADQYTKAIETEKMYIGRISGLKEISNIIKELKPVWPLDGFSHLKRVYFNVMKNTVDVLLRPVREEEDVNLTDSYPMKQVLGDQPINTPALEDMARVVTVAKSPPTTFSQYTAAIQLWPTHFFEDKYLEKALNDKLFDYDEKKKIADLMKTCSDVAQHGDEKVGCVIVDPATSEVIAVAHDRREHHPLQHAIMVAIDLVGRSQGGGCWDIDSEHVQHKPYSQEEVDQKILELKKEHPDKDVKNLMLPYLCTGYDAYISREPCIMCAMALVHSRVRRVFYASKVEWGALGSHCKLHLQDGLNHHFEAFRVEIKDEIRTVKEDDSINDSIS